MLFKSALVAFLLACGAAAVPEGKMIIGYRTVDPKEAEAIKQAGAPVWDGVSNVAARQIGAGIYTSPGAGDWKGKAGDWYCVIYADKDALDRVSKIWVPEYYWKDDGTKVGLWDKPPAIATYINEYKGNNWDATHTLRMAEVRWLPNKLQLLIPPALVGPGGSMGLSAVCASTIDQLPDKDRINYDDWQNNIGGDRKPPAKPEPEIIPFQA